MFWMIKKILKYYKDQNKEKKAAIWFSLCNIINKGISLVVIPIYTRILTIEDYGNYSVLLTWLEILIIIATLEISRGHYPVGITKYDKDINNYTFSMLGLSNVITFIFIIIYFLFYNILTKIIFLPIYLFITIAIYLLSYPAYEFWRIQQRFNYNYKLMVLITLSISIITPICSILYVFIFNSGYISVIISRLIVQSIISIAIYIYYFKNATIIQYSKYWKEAFIFNISLIPYFLSATVLNQADRIMIKNIIGAPEAAIYSVAYSISMLLFLINNAIGDSFVPWLYKQLKNKIYNNIDNITNQLLIIVAVFNLLLVLISPEIILLFAPPKYYSAIWIIPPLTSCSFFIFLFQRYINIEVYYGATKITSLLSIFIAIINIILNYIFIKKYGYYSAGYTTMLCYILFAFFHYIASYYISKNNCEQKLIFGYKKTIVIAIGFLLNIFIIMILYPCLVVRYSLFCLLMIIIVYNKKKITQILNN